MRRASLPGRDPGLLVAETERTSDRRTSLRGSARISPEIERQGRGRGKLGPILNSPANCLACLHHLFSLSFCEWGLLTAGAPSRQPIHWLPEQRIPCAGGVHRRGSFGQPQPPRPVEAPVVRRRPVVGGLRIVYLCHGPPHASAKERPRSHRLD